jgi:crotonobetainyl-CoA:carnitine CoA-transferase CaiB-like acyl-CoA transferase
MLGGGDMAKLLEGVRVLDLSHVYYGPYTTMVLASMGAEVIKIEPPWGEMSRFYPPLVNGESSPFMYLNRCKKGLTLNLKSEEGKAIFFRLLEDADIVVENFKRGTMEKLGLGYDDLRSRKPDIIYAALSGFGVDGPYRDRPSFAPVAEAMSGWMRLTGDLVDPEGPPIRPAEYHGDLDPALWAVVGILAALRHRDCTGVGQLVDVAQLDCMIAQTGIPITNYLAEGKLAWEIWRDRPTAGILFGFFEAADGYVYIAAEAGQVDRLKELTGSELESNEDLQRWVTGKKVNEVVDAIIGVDVPVAPIYQVDEVVEDPQVKARGMIVEIEHPRAGRVRLPGFPVKFSETPAVTGAAPSLGQHNEELLSGLGYGEDEIEALRKKGVIT